MSANGARKAPPKASTRRTIVDPSIYGNVFTDKDKKPISIKIKKNSFKQSNPGNWQENEVIETSKKSDPVVNADSPLLNELDEKILAGFPSGRPLEDKPDTVQCKHCRRPVLRHAAPAHIKDCLNKKQEKIKKKKEAKEAKDAAQRKEKGDKADANGDDDSLQSKGARKSAAKGAEDDAGKKGKKRKADGDMEKGPNAKKKKKDEPKAKTAKPKGPVDVERQCGVPLPNGGQCARSLTCKSHSMGLKRAVPGRSLPYDVLLQQYQKKNQAKQQRAAIEANAPLVDDLDAHGPIDSDEEKEAIMAAIARSRPRPLVTHTFVSTKSKYQYIRMKEMLSNALGGSRGAGLFSTVPMLPGPTPTPTIDTALASARNPLIPSALASAALADGFASAIASPLTGAGFDAVGALGSLESQSRRQSMTTHGGPRTILPGGGGIPQSRKASVSGQS